MYELAYMEAIANLLPGKPDLNYLGRTAVLFSLGYSLGSDRSSNKCVVLILSAFIG
ncbi:hypothetical protein H6F77_17630 [Microcoleus sp. FACHB-831]|uniref:hypothetical protein n=1 Tax=Microcoleus sp. FACHB-831 TaxID=2692827 RepID=UPI0016861265|nr:hypothetical protein [Microcoleus sp. FACHB-831]MBD1922876.1 hypothetical protein [Microcoleus sp. FACHB-831]